jgi:NADPH:quinone reductase-like Zn-dependent oxidoreductase
VRAVTVVDGRLEWGEHPDPEAGAGELLVDVRAAGLNGGDMMQRRGLYAAPPGVSPEIPGMELAGEVMAVGRGVERFAVGDRVMAVVGGGAQAERAVVHERLALPVPGALSWAQAGGFPEVFTTAHDALFTQCELGPGERALIHGAAGGVGIAAVQIAALAGARVTATVRNPDLRDDVAAIGARAGTVQVVAPDAFAEHGPFDVVLELVGALNLAANLAALATWGRISVIGVGAGASTEINLLALMAARGRIHGSLLRPRPLEEKALAARLVEAHVLPFLGDDPDVARLQVPVAETYPMSAAEAAYDRFAAGGKLGKIVLTRS